MTQLGTGWYSLQPMDTLENIFGVNVHDPEVALALALAEADVSLRHALVQLRKLSGLSQQDVADRLGTTQPSVAGFESHDNDPKLSTIRRYAQVVGALVSHQVVPTSAASGWTPGAPFVASAGVAMSTKAVAQSPVSASKLGTAAFALAA